MPELFACVQLEFARPLGPSEGRYVVRCGTPEGARPDVLDVRAIAARVVVGSLKRRRASGGDPLSLVRYTLIRASSEPLDGESAAREWLASMRTDAGARARETEHAIAVLNTAIRAYRTAAGDPYAVEVTRADAHAVRFGAGTARHAFDGEALEWLADRGQANLGRASASGGVSGSPPDRLGPTRAVAAALAGRAVPQGAHDLVLRALLDLRHGAPACAAAGVLGALEVIDAQPLTERARSVARAVLSSGTGDGAGEAALLALLVELREQLHVAATEQLDATPRKVVTDRELLTA